MLQLLSEITITQQPNPNWPNRNNEFRFDFLADFSASSTWQNLSDTAELTIPRTLYFIDKNEQKYTFNGKSVIGLPDSSPLIMKNDKVKVRCGYRWYDDTIQRYYVELKTKFDGWVAEINPARPMTLKLVDNMYVLQNNLAPNKTWKASQYTMGKMVKDLVEPLGFEVRTNDIITNIGDFVTENETIADVLTRLRKDYKIESWFRGNVLTCSPIVYWPADRKEHIFDFQYNIIEYDLTYQRIDDEQVGMEVFSYSYEDNGTNKDGTKKLKTKRFQKFATYQKGKVKIYDSRPSDFQGEIRTLNLFRTPENKLEDAVKRNYNRIFYQGYTGTITVFALPHVKHGDAVILRNPTIPEMAGKYMIKGVENQFGTGGGRQVLTLDMRIDTLTDEEINAGL
jgi:hypothetical protein